MFKFSIVIIEFMKKNEQNKTYIRTSHEDPQ